jgi:hypothetical protein
MVFPGSTASDIESVKDNHCEYIEQEEISQIFSNFQPYPHNHHPLKTHIYTSNHELYRVIPPIQYAKPYPRLPTREEKQECRSTIQSSMIDSMTHSPRSTEETNP